MNCPKCGKAMREGYLFTSKDGAFSFANTVPGVFENAKNADGFVEITPLKPSQFFLSTVWKKSVSSPPMGLGLI